MDATDASRTAKPTAATKKLAIKPRVKAEPKAKADPQTKAKAKPKPQPVPNVASQPARASVPQMPKVEPCPFVDPVPMDVDPLDFRQPDLQHHAAVAMGGRPKQTARKSTGGRTPCLAGTREGIAAGRGQPKAVTKDVKRYKKASSLDVPHQGDATLTTPAF